MRHEPRRCSQDEPDDEEPFVDNHSGSRLVLLLLMIPLTVLAGWAGYSVVRQIAMAAQLAIAGRLAYVGAGVAMLAVIIVFLRWQYALSPRVQSEAEETIDDMSDEPHDEYEEY